MLRRRCTNNMELNISKYIMNIKTPKIFGLAKNYIISTNMAKRRDSSVKIKIKTNKQ